MTLIPPDKIDPTGATDVSAKLSQWLKVHAPLGPIEASAGATYRIDDGLTLQFIDNLDMSPLGTEQPRTRFFTHDPAALDRNRTLLRIYGNRATRVGPVKIQGPNANTGNPPAYLPEVEGQAGIAISNVTNGVSLADGLIVNGTAGDGIYIGANECGIKPARNIAIGAVWLTNLGRQGIAIVNADGVTIKGATILNTARSCIDLEPLATDELPAAVRNVTIDGLTTSGIHLSWIAAMGTGDVSNITIQNCHANGVMIINAHPPYPAVRGRHDWAILNNTSDWLGGGGVPPFNLTHIDGVTIAGNHQPTIVGPTPQTRKPISDKFLAAYLIGNGCTRVTVGENVYNDDGTVAGPSGLPPNTWQ